MSKTGIIVDGPGDFAAVKKRFGSECKVLKTDGPRGHTVGVRELAQSSKKQVNMLRFFGCQRVIILTDFEERTQNYAAFVNELRREVTNLASPVPVLVVVPNRMIENWYLADIENLSKKRTYLRDNLRQRNFEGRHGKRELKRLFKRGIQYNEVKHGADLFQLIRYTVAEGNSQSFRDFMRVLHET